ncbi:GPI anchored serine-threonine rich family protein [Pontibacter sp. G13]|uniref:GPI anchored serine-threonine rich family protein n=1 Tax=Pontibacter sp. G13 TaxID=3074898 RepID=UPI00288AED33|nr:GPI anchored serine-threonine rich family protein [Pontibacter sp. G13]WNJ19202.1 GPI anchored serine-threonine rich family protein [Pontibacter sp. G13]
MRQWLLWMLVWGSLIPLANAQHVQIEEIEKMANGDSLRITYELISPLGDLGYEVTLFARLDTGLKQLTSLTGEFGEEIGPGVHEVVWNAKQELGRYRGKIALEVRALPNFYFITPESGQLFMQGKAYTISWYGKNSDKDALTMTLYRDDEPIDTIATVDASNSYTWRVPRGLDSGEGYRIRVSGTDLSNVDAYTSSFSIQNKKYLKYIIPGAVVATGGVIWIILAQNLPKPFEDIE